MVIFAVLLGGLYSAYKQFSGIDPLQLDPRALVSSLIKDKSPQEFIAILNSSRIGEVLNKQSSPGNGLEIAPAESRISPTRALPSFSFILVADSHNENNYLRRALTQAKEKKGEAKFIIGLGDYTNTGTVEELTLVKKELDGAGLRYFLAVGDHDLWDSRDKGMPGDTNFSKVFGPPYQSFTYENFRFLILNNADNYLGMDSPQLAWLEAELEKAKRDGDKGMYVFMHEPLYHPSSDHVMGLVNKDLKPAAKNLVRVLKDGGAKEAFFGNVHFFSRYAEPESNLSMTVVGALTTANNAQASRFAIVNVFEDGSLGVEDVEIK